MRKIYKNINIAVILMIMVAWQGPANADSMSLRVPVACGNGDSGFSGKFRKAEKALVDSKGRPEKLIINRITGNVEGRFFVGLSNPAFKKLHNVTIKNVRLNKGGVLRIGGKVRVTLKKYKNHRIEIDVDHGVIIELRIYDEKGRLIRERRSSDPDEKAGHRKFAIIIDKDTSQYKDSFYGKLVSGRFKELHNVTIKNFRLSGESLSIGGKPNYATFSRYPDHKIEMDIEHGVIAEVRIYDERGRLIKEKKSSNPDEKAGHRKFAIIVDRSTRKYEDSFYWSLLSDKFKGLHNKTIKNLRLSEKGTLEIGGEPRGTFTKYPNHKIEMDVDQGVVTEVRIYDEAGKLIKEKKSSDPDERAGHRKFAIIADRTTGRYEDSFYVALAPDEFEQLNNKTIKNLRLDKSGGLKINTIQRINFAKYPKHKIEIDIDNGAITEVRIYDEDMKPIDYYLFKIVIDEDIGETISSFRCPYVPSKTWAEVKRTHKARIVWTNLSDSNVIKLNNAKYSEYFDFTSIGDFTGKDVTIYFENGEISRFEIDQGEDGILIILPDEIRKQSGWFNIFSQQPTGYDNGDIVPVVDDRETTALTIDLDLLKEEIAVVLEGKGYYDAERWWKILLELGETDDTEDRIAEEIIAERYNVSVSDILKVIRALSQNEDIRGFLLQRDSPGERVGIKSKGMKKNRVLLETSM